MNNDEMFDKVFDCISEMVYTLPEEYLANLDKDYVIDEVYGLLTELYENEEEE